MHMNSHERFSKAAGPRRSRLARPRAPRKVVVVPCSEQEDNSGQQLQGSGATSVAKDNPKEILKRDAEARMREIIEQVSSRDVGATDSSGTADIDFQDRIRGTLARVTEGLVERDTQARLLVLAALAAEHVLFLGPPGTAKSELSRRLHSALQCRSYFERLLTRFSVPEEIFGPLSMRALEQDMYLRNTEGYLPQQLGHWTEDRCTISITTALTLRCPSQFVANANAEVAFIDEIFKANSAILNTLLTLLNERLFDNGQRRSDVPLVCLIAASNELPESEELDALYDRFLIRCSVEQITSGGLSDLLTAVGNQEDNGAAAHTELLSLDELRSVQQKAVTSVTVPRHIVNLLVDLRTYMQESLEPPAYVSDRRLVKAVALLQVSAFTNGRLVVNEYDALLLRHVLWSRPEEQERIYDWLLSKLAVDGDLKQSNYILASLFGRTCHSLQDEAKLDQILVELRELKDVLVQRACEGADALHGGFTAVKGHLWIAAEDGDAVAAALLPKLQKAQSSIQTTLFEVVTLELAVERRVSAVVLANLMPRYWADFIRSSSDQDARDLGTVPRK